MSLTDVTVLSNLVPYLVNVIDCTQKVQLYVTFPSILCHAQLVSKSLVEMLRCRYVSLTCPGQCCGVSTTSMLTVRHLS